MSLAAGLSTPRSMMLTLVEAGAHLDFRNAAGQTATHRAARLGNDIALKVTDHLPLLTRVVVQLMSDNVSVTVAMSICIGSIPCCCKSNAIPKPHRPTARR